MKTQNIIIAHPSDAKEMKVIKAFFEALKIKFEIAQDSPYDPEFVAKIQKGREDYKNGKGVEISMEELNALCK